MSDQQLYVRFSESVETRESNEAEVIDGIIAAMTRESQTVAERDGLTVRASHAKSTGLLKGRLEVLPDLPIPLRQGLFSEARGYPVLVRLAQGPGEKLSDSVSTHRGMAMKVFGAVGEKLPSHEATTQDFVFSTGTAFAQSGAATFLTAIKGLQKSTGLPESIKQAVSATSRVTNAAFNVIGSDSPTFGFFGHSKRTPLADAYFSQAALRYGDYIAKMGVFPVTPELVAAIDQTLETSVDPNVFRHAVVDYFRTKAAEFELRVQLCISLDTMPVENASVEWPEVQSPYVPVARLSLPAQDAYSPAREAYFDQILSFQPAHTLAAHRPLGSLMRARLATYQALSTYRHRQNGQEQVEPTEIDQVPD